MMLLLTALASGESGSVWSPTDKTAGMGITNFGLTATATATKDAVRADRFRTTGLLYYEVTANGPDQILIGLAAAAWPFADYLGQVDTNSAAYFSLGPIYAHGVLVATGSGYTAGDVIGVATYIDARRVFFSKNGVWQNSSNPVTGVGGIDYGTNDPIAPAFQAGFSTGSGTLNVGDAAFAHAPPVGYSAWG